MSTARNVAIVLVLALIVAVAPGGGAASEALLALLSIVFLGSLVLLAARMYRENRVALYSLGDQRRGVLYGAVAVAALAVAATPRLWESGGGAFLWFALVGAASYAVFAVYRSSREY